MRNTVLSELPRRALIAAVALFSLTAFSVGAGTLWDSDEAQLDLPPPVDLQCGDCTFITTNETVPLPADPNEQLIVLTVVSTLLVIGFVGIKFRVRARRIKPVAR